MNRTGRARAWLVGAGLLVVIAAATLAIVYFDRNVSAETARFSHADVLAALPAVDNVNCRTVIGEYTAAPDLLISHMEGAVANTSSGFTTVSGFSHYLKSRLLASARVDSLPAGSMNWLVQPVPSPTIASHIQGAAHGDALWIAGGFIGQHPGRATRDVWRLDTVSGKWTSQAPLPFARASGAFVESAGRLHYISGLHKDRQTDLDEHISIDARNPQEWKVESVFPRPRNHFQAVSIGPLIFAVGGLSGHDKSKKDLPYLDVYHPTFQQWIPMADLPEARSHAELATFVYDNRIIVAGGRTAENADQSLDSVIEYNPHTNQWSTISTLAQPRYSPFANIVDNQFYLAGGGLTWREPRTEAWTASLSTRCEQIPK